MSEKADRVEYKGRRKIYTDVDEINKDNVVDVLQKALSVHTQNADQIRFLIDFEKGHQPLKREKKIREDIDVTDIDNLAHQITEFWLGYFWGNHMAFVQKSDRHPDKKESKDNDEAISILNAMYDAEDMGKKDQLLAYYLEVCGICCQLIDYKRDPQEEDALFDLVTLNPLYSFVVYSSDAFEKPMMGVSFSEKEDGTRKFSCITDKQVFEIINAVTIVNGAKKVDGFKQLPGSGQRNPFGKINIIEFERSTDRTGVFERQIDELNALNILESDLVNDVAQTTQAIWWGNDIELDKDENGNVKGPQGGQWMLTKTAGNGNKPDVKALVLNYDYNGVLADIQAKHDGILERTFTPLQTEQTGGSTTGATSISSGWAATEAVACKQSEIIISGYKQRNALVLIACKLSDKIPQDSPLLKLKNADIDIRPVRQKTYDMSSKVNSLAVLIQNQVNPRVAMEAVDFFPNLAEAVEDSYDNMEKYQKLLLKDNDEEEEKPDQSMGNPLQNPNNPDDALEEESLQDKTDRNMQDSSDQAKESPLSEG